MEPFRKLADRSDEPLLFQIKSWSDRYPELTAGFTSRHGGVSEEPFASLNCGLHVADNPQAVIQNRERVAQIVGAPLTEWTYGEQVHGVDVVAVTKDDRGKGTTDRQSALQGKDAFITNQQGIVLAALFADCVPLYFYDPVHRAAGLAHAGWKGTVGRIAWHTVKEMEERYGSRPEQMLACIGPSIQACCYEVDERVAERVRELLPWFGGASRECSSDAPANGWMISKGQGKYMLDLQQINRQIMIKAGIMPSCIEISKLCTSCRCDIFFSHRKECGQTGRMTAWIGLR